MFKALLGTNIIVDAFARRQPFCESAEELLRFAATERFTACLSGSSLTDIYYIISRQIDHEKGMEAVRTLLKILKITPVGHEVCLTATTLKWNDYEDAVLIACGLVEKVDFIITRDKGLSTAGGQMELPFTFLSPDEFLALEDLFVRGNKADYERLLESIAQVKRDEGKKRKLIDDE